MLEAYFLKRLYICWTDEADCSSQPARHFPEDEAGVCDCEELGVVVSGVRNGRNVA